MFRKIFISLLLIGLLTISFSKADIQGVYFRFCDMENEKDQRKTVNIQPGGEAEVCLNFYTTDQDPVVVKYGFSKGLLNENQIQVCDQDMTDTNDFAKLFSSSEGSREFELTNGIVKTLKEKIKVPLGMNGMTYGCLAYTVTKDNKRVGNTFDLVVRKVANLNLFIGGDSDIKSSIKLLANKGKLFSSNNKIKAEEIDGELRLSFLVENNSNISQVISMSGKIQNALGFQLKFDLPTKKIIPSASEEFKVNVGILPFYKGPFTVKVNGISEPSFDFDISNLDPKLKEPILFSENGQIFIFTWIWIVILIIAIFILYLILRPLFKKHHIETTPTTNTQ